MKRQPVNLLPKEWRSAPLSSLPVHSLAITCVLAFVIAALGWLQAPDLPVHAATRVGPSPHDRRVFVELFDDAAYSLARASCAHPWHAVFVRLSEVIDEHASLDSLTFDRVSCELDLSGKIRDTGGIPLLMAALDEFDWVTAPDPYRLELNNATGFYTFQIKARVAPLIEWEEGS